MDFSTLERRRHFCQEEVRLNRSMAPEVYRRVVAIRRQADGSLKIGGDGELLEYAVEMEPGDSGCMSPELHAFLIECCGQFVREQVALMERRVAKELAEGCPLVQYQSGAGALDCVFRVIDSLVTSKEGGQATDRTHSLGSRCSKE